MGKHDHEKKDGLSVQEIENFGKHYRLEIFFSGLFFVSSICSFLIFSPAWSIYALGLGGILGAILGKHVSKFILGIFNFCMSQQKPTKEAETKPEEKKEATPTQANSDVKNAGEAALNDFSNSLARHIAKFKMYPKIAQMRGWQGELVLEVKLNGEGELTSSKIVKSSGFDVLDNEGLEMVKRASPFPVPPEILKGKSFSILVPIRFKLE